MGSFETLRAPKKESCPDPARHVMSGQDDGPDGLPDADERREPAREGKWII